MHLDQQLGAAAAPGGTGGPAPTLTVGMVVTRDGWEVFPAARALLGARARAALVRAADRQGVVVTGEPTETVARTEQGGAVITVTAAVRPA